MKKKINELLTKIKGKEDALKVIEASSLVFFIVATLQACFGFFSAPSLIKDAILYALLAVILLIWKSRVAAVSLLFLSGVALAITTLNKAGVAAEGGNNIILSVIVFWVAIRAVEATFKFHSKKVVTPLGKEYISLDCPAGDITLQLGGDGTFELELKCWDSNLCVHTSSESLSGKWQLNGKRLLLNGTALISFKRELTAMTIDMKTERIDSLVWVKSSERTFADKYILMEKQAVDDLLQKAIPPKEYGDC